MRGRVYCVLYENEIKVGTRTDHLTDYHRILRKVAKGKLYEFFVYPPKPSEK